MIQTLIVVVCIGFAYKLLNELVNENVPLYEISRPWFWQAEHNNFTCP